MLSQSQPCSDATNARKVEHIEAINRDPLIERGGSHFEQIRLTHKGMPEIALSDVDTSCSFLGHTLSFPLVISSMTGGDHPLITTINTNLAIAAQECGVGLAVGSQRVMFTNEAARASFQLRHHAPDVPLIANLGAVQFNYGFTADHAQEAIDVLDADGLYLHLNPLQEAVQPEGDTDFRNLETHIGTVASKVTVPVILKEIGCGLSPSDIERGLRAGVRFFDVAGSGGTSWSRIEHHRRSNNHADIGLVFQDWGLPTPQALRLAEPYLADATLIASGGIRTGLDMVKAVTLGASICGVARPFLQPAMTSAAAVVTEINRLKTAFGTAMFLLGETQVSGIQNNRSLIVSTGQG